jgi:hypothetical protein
MKGSQIMRKLFNDEVGFVISAELVLVMTIAVLAMVVGLASVRDAVTQEMNDISQAFGAVSQTYQVTGLRKPANNCDCPHGSINGFGYKDTEDDCDCQKLELTCATIKRDPSVGQNYE